VAATGSADGFLERFTALPPARREAALVDLVRGAAAEVLGHHGADDLEADRRFQDLGFDSLTAVELRNHLATATGLRLPVSLLFDHPTPAEVAGYLLPRLAPHDDDATTVLAELDRLRTRLDAMAVDERLHRTVAGRLEVLLASWTAPAGGEAGTEEFDFTTASDDEMFSMLDSELESP
jgi:acyl carrier protein